MFLLDMEISLENINDAILKINEIMKDGTDDGDLIYYLQNEARKMFPYLGHSVESTSFEGESIHRIYFDLRREGREMEECWPMLVEGLNDIYKYLCNYW